LLPGNVFFFSWGRSCIIFRGIRVSIGALKEGGGRKGRGREEVGWEGEGGKEV
jgi:hypothetical protein